MNMKKLITMLMALMMVLALAACGSNDTPAANNDGNDGDNAAPTYANALEKIKGEGELHVALSPDFSPMEFVDSSKTGQEQYVGFDVSLAKFIAEELGVSRRTIEAHRARIFQKLKVRNAVELARQVVLTLHEPGQDA